MMNPKWSISSRLNPNKKKLQETKCRTLMSAICEEGGPLFRLPVTKSHKKPNQRAIQATPQVRFSETPSCAMLSATWGVS